MVKHEASSSNECIMLKYYIISFIHNYAVCKMILYLQVQKVLIHHFKDTECMHFNKDGSKLLL